MLILQQVRLYLAHGRIAALRKLPLPLLYYCLQLLDNVRFILFQQASADKINVFFAKLGTFEKKPEVVRVEGHLWLGGTLPLFDSQRVVKSLEGDRLLDGDAEKIVLIEKGFQVFLYIEGELEFTLEVLEDAGVDELVAFFRPLEIRFGNQLLDLFQLHRLLVLLRFRFSCLQELPMKEQLE